jgi:nitrite reductase/ring-hydroxylating ferredoxin subunit/Fe-S cluster biogenesis protein NfuA
MNQTASQPTLTVDDFELLAEKVDRAIAEVRGLPEEAKRKALAMKSAIEELHKVGLTKIVRSLKVDPRGKELLFELVDDPAVRMLFGLHGLIRADLQTRVQRVVEMVRPQIQAHGGDVSLIEVREGVVWVRLSGSCTGCSMSATTLRTTIEEAIVGQCPEIREVRQVPDEPGQADALGQAATDGHGHDHAHGHGHGHGHTHGHAGPALVQLGLPPRAGNLAASGWVAGPPLESLELGRAVALATPVAPVALVRTPGGVRAFRNECAHQGLPLDGGTVDAEAGTITCPWHGWRFDCDSGECLTAPAAQLEQYPVRIENGIVWVRPE